MGSSHPQKRIHGDDGRADIEGGFRGSGNPVFFRRNELFQGIEGEIFINLRYAKTPAGTIQALDVFLGPKQLDLSGFGAVCLESFKNPLAIVQKHGGWIHLHRRIGFDARIMPSLLLIVIHVKHVIGKNRSKAELGIIRL